MDSSWASEASPTIMSTIEIEIPRMHGYNNICIYIFLTFACLEKCGALS